MNNNNVDNLSVWLSKETGISQRQLAKWLQTDHSLLTRMAQGTRTLPSGPLLKLVEAWKMLNEFPVPELQDSRHTQDVELFKRLANEWDWKANEKDKQIQYHQLKYRQGLRALQWLQTLKQTETPITPKMERWIAESIYQAQQKLQKHGPAVWMPLEIERDMLRMGVARLAELSSDPMDGV